MKGLGEKLKELRLERGMTQKYVAEQIDVSLGTISFWENDVNEPKATHIVALAALYDISIDDLLKIDDY